MPIDAWMQKSVNSSRLVGADGGDDAGAGGSGQKNVALSLVVASRGKASIEVVGGDGRGA